MALLTYALLAAALALPAAAAAQSPAGTQPEPPVVIVRGEGIVRAAPDRALVRIGAESRARVAKEAQSANAAAMTAVLAKIRAAGIPADAVRTVTVSLQQEYDYSDGRQTPRGYLARNIVEVRVDDLAKLPEILDVSTSSGATTIHGLRFDLKERSKLEREALTLAVADATARAEAAAAGARRTVDRVVKIDETLQPQGPRPMQEFAQMAADTRAAAAPPIAEGEIELRATVTVTAVIK